MRQMNINKGNYEVKSHYKMYKAGKRWVVAGMATVSLLGGLLMLSTDASADNVDAVVPASESSVTTQVSTPTDSVVLDHASASVAPASSVSAEVSDSSVSSVVPVSVVSAEASLSTSQSLASSVVVPAGAVKTGEGVDADGNPYEEYALAAVQDATVTEVVATNEDVPYSATPDGVNWEVVAGSMVASANIVTSNAATKSNFEYIGSGKSSNNVNPNFKQTGDITYGNEIKDESGKVTGYVDNVNVNANFGGMSVENVKQAVTRGKEVADAALPDSLKNNTSAIDWQAITPQVKNEGGTLAYGTKVKTDRPFEIRGAYRVLPINTDKTVGDTTDVGTNASSDGTKAFGGGQAVGIIMAPVSVEQMGTTDMINPANVNVNNIDKDGNKNKQGNVDYSLNLSDGIEGVSNALIAGRDLFPYRQADADALLVHIRQTNAAGILYGSEKKFQNSNGTTGVGTDKITIPTDGTSLPATGNATLMDGTKVDLTSNVTGYAVADAAYEGKVNENGVNTNLNVTQKIYNSSNNAQQTADKHTLFKNYISNGVYFDYSWQPEMDTTTNQVKYQMIGNQKYIYAVLTYSEYSDPRAIEIGDGLTADQIKQAKKDSLLSTVTGRVLVQSEMAIGLFAGNGGNGQSFFGGISYFKGTNVTNDVQIKYQFKDDQTDIINGNKVTALNGETVQVKGTDKAIPVADGKNVASYDAPEIAGFTVDKAATGVAVAGASGAAGELVVHYTVDKAAFNGENSPLGDAKKSQTSIGASVKTAQNTKTNAEKALNVAKVNDPDEKNPVTQQLQKTVNSLEDVVTQLTTIQGQIDDVVIKLTNATTDESLDKFKTANDVATNLADFKKTAKEAADKASQASALANTDIVRENSVATANGVVETVTHGDDEDVQGWQNKVIDILNSGTTDEINEAVAKLQVADDTVVPVNVADDSGVIAAKKAVDDALNAKTYNADDVTAKVALLKKAEDDAKDALTKAKQAATNAVTGWNDDKAKYTDQDKASLTKIDGDIATLTGLTAKDDTTASAIVKARQQLETDIKTVSGLRDAAVTTAEDVVSNKVQHKDELTDRIATVEDATKTGTQQEIETAVADLKAADQVATDTEVPANVADDSGVTTAKKAVDDALNAKTYNADDIAAKVATLKKAEEAAKDALTKSKQAATTTVNSWNDDKAEYTDQDKASLAKIDADIATLTGLTAKDDTTASAIDKARTQLETDVKAVSSLRDAAVTAAEGVVSNGVRHKDDLTGRIAAVEDAKTTGTQQEIETAVANLKAADKVVTDTEVPANVADDSGVTTAKKAVDNALNAKTYNADDVATKVAALKKAEDDAKEALTKSKQAATNTVAGWNNDKAKYTDQDKASLAKIDADIATLTGLTTKDETTASTIDKARQQLEADIKAVSGLRDATVTTAEDVVSNKVQHKDELTGRVAAVEDATKTGTQQEIETAVANLKAADQIVTDTEVPANVADNSGVIAAKKAVDDALNAKTYDADDVASKVALLKKAEDDAKDALTKSKQAATTTVAGWNDDKAKYTDQDKASLAKIDADIVTLTGLTAKDDTTASAINKARTQLETDVKAVSSLRDAAVTTAEGVVSNGVQHKDELTGRVAAVEDAKTTGTQQEVETAVANLKAADQVVTDTEVPASLADDSGVTAAKKAVDEALNAKTYNANDIATKVETFKKAEEDAKTVLTKSKQAATNTLAGWNDDKVKYTDQDKASLAKIDADIATLTGLTAKDDATASAIDEARNQLDADIKNVTNVRNDAVKDGNATVDANKDNGDPEVKLTVGKLNVALKEGTASAIKKAIENVKTAVDTVVVPNIADSKIVADAKTAVNDALNAPQVNMSEVQKAVESFNKAVTTAQGTLKQAVTDANAVKVPANLQDQVEMAKKNKLGDVNQQVMDLHNAAGQADTTASTLRSAMNDIQGSLDDMTAKLNTMRDAAQKLVEQTADATDKNVVAARQQLTNLLANNDTTTMTDLQNAMNVLTATSKPATANTVETSSATVESDQVSTPVANGDAAFAIVTDANGKQTVVQLDKTENGTATANVPGATDAQVVTVPKNGNKPFIFVTDGSGTAQYTELTPNGVKTTITPDGTSTKTTNGKTLDVPADGDVTVMYLPTAEVSVQAGAKNVAVPGKTGYTATVTDAQGNEVTLTDGMIAVDGVPAGTNYLVTYTPDPAKVVVKLGTDSGFAKGEEPAAGNTNAQTLMTVQDALNKLQKDDATLAAIVSTGYTDTKVNVTNAVEALNRVDQNLNIDGYAHRIQAPDGTQYDSLEAAVKANPTFAAGTTQMKVVYAPLDGQKIQVKDADGNVLGTVMGKSDAEINVDDFKSVDADLQAKAEKGKLKMTVTAPDGKTYDSLMDALQATGYFDHVGLEDGPSSFDQSDAKFVATAWDETGKATAGYMVLGEPATPNDLNIQDFVVSFAPANDGAGHNNSNAGSKTGSSVAANNQNGDQVNVFGPANGSRDGSEVNNATVSGQASGAQVTGSQTGATANPAQNAGWQAQGATQNSDNTASLLAAAGNEQQANTANSDDARITEMPDSAAVIQDSILPLESAKQAMNLTGRVTEDNFLVVVAAMVASGLFGLLLAFWRRRKEDDQATR